MKTDPSGIEEDIDDAQRAVDIFVLCGNSPDAELLGEQLAPQGYRVTIFTESTHLLETIRAGKPNLLICDATNPEVDGYEFCREIKSDYDLWIVPVLLITGINNLGDLLKVLSSNADNFIARPYNLPYLLSLVESVFGSSIEKPDPEKIKTQFKISYDDFEYVITADRRKILEFLLSSFEININQAAEIVQIRQDLEQLRAELEQRVNDRTQELSEEVNLLDTTVREHAASLARKSREIKEKEEREKNLQSTLLERETSLVKTSELLSQTQKELEKTTTRLSESDDKIHSLLGEKERLALELNEKIAILTRERDDLIPELDRTKQLLDEESRRSVALDATRAELVAEKELRDQELSQQACEIQEINRVLAEERNKAITAGQEYASELQGKSRVEAELRQALTEITEKARVREDDFSYLNDALVAEKDLRTTAERNLASLEEEKTHIEADLRMALSEITDKSKTLQDELGQLNDAHSAEKQLRATVESNLASYTEKNVKVEAELRQALTEITEKARVQEDDLNHLNDALVAEKDLRTTAERDLASLAEEKIRVEANIRQSLDDITEKVRIRDDELTKVSDDLSAEKDRRTAAEQWIETLLQEKLQREATLGAEKESLREQRDGLQEKMDAVTAAIGAERQKNISLGEELKTVRDRNEQANSGLQALNRDFDLLKSSYAEENQLRIRLEAQLTELHNTQDATRALHTQELEKIQQDLDTHRSELTQVHGEQESVKNIQLHLEEELVAAVRENDQAEKRVQLIQSDIEKLQTELDTERNLHQTSEETLKQVMQEKDRIEKNLHAITAEKISLDDSRAARIQKLKEDLETMLTRQKSLEAQLLQATEDIQEKDGELRAISDKCEELIAAFNEEKEKRHNAEEELAGAREKLREEPGPAVHAAQPVIIASKNHALTMSASGLPRIISTPQHAVSIIETPHESIQTVRGTSKSLQKIPETSSADKNIPSIRGVEDLFEDIPEVDIDELSDATATPDEIHTDEDIPAEAPSACEPEDDQESVDETTPVLSYPADDAEDEEHCFPESEVNDAVHDGSKIVPEESPEETGDEVSDEGNGTDSSEGYEPEQFRYGMTFDRQHWLDLIKWAHNEPSLSHDDKLRIVRIGRLIQRGRLSRKQEDQVSEIIAFAHSRGYNPN